MAKPASSACVSARTGPAHARVSPRAKRAVLTNLAFLMNRSCHATWPPANASLEAVERIAVRQQVRRAEQNEAHQLQGARTFLQKAGHRAEGDARRVPHGETVRARGDGREGHGP